MVIYLSLAEALEEVATRVAEEAWLYNEYAFYISFDYIHCSNLNSYIRFFRITPSLFSQRGLHFLPKPLFNSLYDPFGSPCRGQKPQEAGM